MRILLDSTHAGDPRADGGAVAPSSSEGQRLAAGGARRARRARAAAATSWSPGAQQFAALEQRALEHALARGGQALGAGDVALAAGEDVERLRGVEAGSRDRARARRRSSRRRSLRRRGRSPREGAATASAVRLPAARRRAGHRGSGRGQRQRRSVARADARDGARRAGHGAGRRASSAFRARSATMTGSLIIDHGGGWMSLIVNVVIAAQAGRQASGSASRSAARSARCRSNCPKMGVESRLLSSQVHLKPCQMARKGG